MILAGAPDMTDLKNARLCILASGSSGNALFLAAGGVRLLVDVGLPGTDLRGRLASIGERIEDLNAVLITHEHGDHTRGLPDLVGALPELPVYATAGTARHAGPRLARGMTTEPLRSGHPEMFGGLRVLPFSVSHDAAEPVGFRFDIGDLGLGMATDLGVSPPDVRQVLVGCRALILESNHDAELLRTGPYPPFVKRRVAGRGGHLSNRQMQSLLADVAGPRLEHVVLVHLSRRNNSPERAEAAARAALKGSADSAVVSVGDPFKVGEVLSFAVRPGKMVAAPIRPERVEPPGPTQLGLFDQVG